MQTVYFKKSENPSGKLKSAERYGFSLNNNLLLGVSLVGKLTEHDEETWEAKRTEVSCSMEATAENAIAVFRQAGAEIGYEIDESYIRTVFGGEDDVTMNDMAEALRKFGVEV